MRFQRHLELQHGLHPIHVIPAINVVFLLLIFFILTSPLCFQPEIKVKLPRAVTSDILKEENVIITITGENLTYYNDSLVTIKELQAKLIKQNNRKLSVLIKADRSTSLGRIVDVWNLCRALGVEGINLATNQGP